MTPSQPAGPPRADLTGATAISAEARDARAIPSCMVATGEPVTGDDLEAIALKEPWAGADLLRHGGLRGSERRQPALARRVRQSRLPTTGAVSRGVAPVAHEV